AGSRVEGRCQRIDFGDLAMDYAIIKLIAVLEERVLVQAIAFTRARILVDGIERSLEIAERPRSVERHQIFPAVLDLERADFRVGGTGNTLEEPHVGASRGVVGRIQRGGCGRKSRAVV